MRITDSLSTNEGIATGAAVFECRNGLCCVTVIQHPDAPNMGYALMSQVYFGEGSPYKYDEGDTSLSATRLLTNGNTITGSFTIEVTSGPRLEVSANWTAKFTDPIKIYWWAGETLTEK